MIKPKRATEFCAFSLQRDSVQPLYLQLADMIRIRIQETGLRPGQLLPSEATFCQKLGISRITVRQALDELISKKLIERRQGKGTFIAHPVIRSDLVGANKLYDTLFAQKHAPGSRLLAFGLDTAPPDVLETFGYPSKTSLLRVDRLYLLDDRPVGVALGWLHPAVAVVQEDEVATHSTASLIEKVFGLPIATSEVSIGAALAGRNIARHLDLSERAPVLTLRRSRSLLDGRRVDLIRMFMNADSYEFTIDNLLALEAKHALKLVAA